MITWHVVHAQLPPHACSSGTPRFFATSRNDSGLPWFEYGRLPLSNSTVVGSPSMMNVTLGISPSGFGIRDSGFAPNRNSTANHKSQIPNHTQTSEMFLPDEAACTERFIITSARSCVVSFNTLVHF